MCDAAQVILALFVGGGLLTFIKRYGAKNSSAGEGVAGWTIALVAIVLIKFFFLK